MLSRLKIRRQQKIIPNRATPTRTASSLATILPTSFETGVSAERRLGKRHKNLQARNERLPFPINALNCLSHLLFGDITVIVLIEYRKRCRLRTGLFRNCLLLRLGIYLPPRPLNGSKAQNLLLVRKREAIRQTGYVPSTMR